MESEGIEGVGSEFKEVCGWLSQPIITNPYEDCLLWRKEEFYGFSFWFFPFGACLKEKLKPSCIIQVEAEK